MRLYIHFVSPPLLSVFHLGQHFYCENLHLLVLQAIGTMTKSGFLDDSEIVDEAEEDGSDEEGELFDSVCAICDNGGELLWYVFFCYLLQSGFRIIMKRQDCIISLLSSSFHHILFFCHI